MTIYDVSVDQDDDLAEVEEVSHEEGRRLLHDAARRHLNMTADEFIDAWDRGLFAEPDTLAVQQVAQLLTFGR